MTQTTVIILLLASIFFWLFSQLIHRPLLTIIQYLQLLKNNPETLQKPQKQTILLKVWRD